MNDLCDLDQELGTKGRSGILRSQAARAAFLADPTHRIRIVYTPKHTSWLNQIELWFSILVRRLLKRASFTSVEELRARVLAFIEYFNRTMAVIVHVPCGAGRNGERRVRLGQAC